MGLLCIFMMNTTFSNLSAPATVRWKSQTTRVSVSSQPSTVKRLRKLITSGDTTTFLDSTMPLTALPCITKQDEVKEVSAQLKLLRWRHDRTHIQFNHQEATLDFLGREAHELGKIKERGLSLQEENTLKLERLEKEVEFVKYRQQEALNTRKTYQHMLERMKKSHIKFEMKAKSLSYALKQQEQILKEEQEKQRKTQESKIQTKSILNRLQVSIVGETETKKEELDQLQSNLKLREETSRKRDERQKRQLEIIEIAANEERDKRAMEIREKMMLHRLWLKYLNWKLHSEITKSNAIEEAFQQIRAATGVQNIDDIVEKFLTKEHAYCEVTDTISELQSKVSEYKLRNQKLEESIHKLTISKSEGKFPINNLSLDVKNTIHDLAMTKDKHSLMSIETEKVLSWLAKYFKKLQMVGSVSFINETPSVYERISTLKFDVLKLLRELRSFKEGNTQAFFQTEVQKLEVPNETDRSCYASTIDSSIS